MKKINDININTRIYWNESYGNPQKRAEYRAQKDTVSRAGNMLISPTGRFAKALSYVKAGDRVIDMGCGVGVFTNLVRENNPTCEVWGTDISDTAIEENKKENGDIVYYHQYIGHQDKVPDDYFDVVFSGEVLEHLNEPVELFNDAYRALKDDGVFVLTTPLENKHDSDEHVWSFTKDDIESLAYEAEFSRIVFKDLPNGESSKQIFAVMYKK